MGLVLVLVRGHGTWMVFFDFVLDRDVNTISCVAGLLVKNTFGW